MTDEQILSVLTGIFRDILEDDNLVLTPDLSAEQVPEWDSLSHVRLMLKVQKTFDVKFSAAQISGMKNVGDLVKIIETKIN